MTTLESEQFWRVAFNGRAAIGLGTTKIWLALFSVAFGAQGILTYAAYHYIGFGIWGGALVMSNFYICGACLHIFILLWQSLVAGAVAVAAGISASQSKVIPLIG